MPNNNNKLIDVVLNHIKTVGLSTNIMYKDNYVYKRNETEEVDDPNYLPIGNDFRGPDKITVTNKIYDFIRTYKVVNGNDSFELQVNEGEIVFSETEDYQQPRQIFKTTDFHLLKGDMEKNIGLLWMICSIFNIDALKLFKDDELINLENKRLELLKECKKIDDKINSLSSDKEQLQKNLFEIDSMIEKYEISESKSVVKK